ncbi:MAG: PQQ-dependent sugar dehydrogenase [Nitrososphaeraceae archaeon]|nr:PQQ-dependent sugar dehydrogenase [Nitrososphaeraceae archaeon]MDW0242230.1 PQQ-dependent sugar dehydrogenase [Nitrososphaeraceae archaeon]MDW0250556.1 PQQ-dependent sugar dehydrogenase [Nitrososphaeraceae archaeon]MDW0264042.1 PQQ-dependent sugar dehydrogenase [Nitrososphaeraceae archaeon]MDW0286907.1 PQQ-dependent sugar dehydrogenase [Nitrososphaeraceae archaeon]
MERRQLIKLVIPSALVIIVSILTMKFSPSETLVPLPAPVSNLSLTNTSGVEIIAEGLQAPRSIDISKEGRIFISEKRGSIRVVDNGTLLTEPVGDIKAENIGDAGLLGLTLHPNFTQNHLFYVYYTYSNGTGLFNKVLMLKESNNRIIDSKTILDGIPGNDYRDGGRIKFGRDGKLYVSTGDASIPELSQDLNSLAGKILRINEDGTVPQDNPFSNSAVYAYGFRNAQGLAWAPNSGALYSSDQGGAGNDEINLISPAKNYGWPHEECNSSGDDNRYTPPLVCFNPSLEPSGIAFAFSNKLGYQNHLIVATLKGSHLRDIDFDSGSQNTILVGYGRIIDLVESEDGLIYVLTSNTDGRALPQQGDDKILRLTKS